MVKNIRLKNMIELVAEVEDNLGEKILLKKPAQVSWDGMSETYTMMMVPFIENNLTDATEVYIDRSEILYIVDMKEAMVEIYQTYSGKFYAPRQLVPKTAAVKNLADYKIPPGKN